MNEVNRLMQAEETIKQLCSMSKEEYIYYISNNGLSSEEVRALCKYATDEMIEDFLKVAYPLIQQEEEKHNCCPSCSSEAVYTNDDNQLVCIDCGRVMDISRPIDVVRMIASGDCAKFKSYVLKHKLRSYELEFMYDHAYEIAVVYTDIILQGGALWDED